MSLIFGTANTVFVAAKTNTQAGRGAHFNFGNAAAGNAQDLGAIVTAFDTREADSYTLTRGLNGNNYITIFGEDIQTTRVTLATGIKGNCSDGNDDSLKVIAEKFNANRLSSDKPTFSSLVYGGRVIKGYLVAMTQASTHPVLSQITLELIHPSNRKES